MFWQKKDSIITHSGSFHPDDVFAVATLHLYYQKIKKSYKLIRTTNPDIIQAGDIVLDIGGEYNQQTNRFDHHQKGGAGKRPNGIPFASFGLIWKKYGPLICDSQEIANQIDASLVQAIDASDNGVSISRNIYEEVSPVFVQNLLQSFNTTFQEEHISNDFRFEEAMSIAMLYLKRVIHQTKIQYQVDTHCEDNYAKQEQKEILIIDELYGRSALTIAVSKLPKVLYFVYPSKRDGGWNVCASRVSLDSFESKKPFPESWCGLRDESLQKSSGIATATFCHNSGFLCVAQTKEDAIELAKKALKA